jgi:hypothetical protein
MGYNGKDRRGSSSERRKSGDGAPPPGTVIDRRLGLDPRTNSDPRKSRKTTLVPNGQGPSASPETGAASPTENGHTGLERKRGRGRRLSEFTKSAEEGEMTTEQFLFLMAVDAFKKGNDRMFPTWTDVLEVIRLLGYRKTMPSDLNLPAAEDWLERSDSPANVRPDRWAERFTETGSKADGSTSDTAGPKVGPKSEEELTDEALEAFEAAFGEDDDTGADFDLDSDFEDGFSEAA